MDPATLSVLGCLELVNIELLYKHWLNNVWQDVYTGRSVKNTLRAHSRQVVQHEPKMVEEKNNITILYVMPIHTDREISANRPDIVIKTIGIRNTLSLMWLYPLIKILPPRFPKKVSKHKDHEIEITRMWQMKTEIIPVVVRCVRND